MYCKHGVSLYCQWEYSTLGGYKHTRARIWTRCFKKDWLIAGQNTPDSCGVRCDCYTPGTNPLDEDICTSPLRYDKEFRKNYYKEGGKVALTIEESIERYKEAGLM